MNGVLSSAASLAGLYGPQTKLHAIKCHQGGRICFSAAEAAGQCACSRVRRRQDRRARAHGSTWPRSAPFPFLDGAICSLLFLESGAVPLALAEGRHGPRLHRVLEGLAVPDARADAAKDSAAATDFALQASIDTRLAYVVTGNDETGTWHEQGLGLSGLSKVLNARTAVEPSKLSRPGPVPRRTRVLPADPVTYCVLARVRRLYQAGRPYHLRHHPFALLAGSLTGNRARTAPWASSSSSGPARSLQRVPEGHAFWRKASPTAEIFPRPRGIRRPLGGGAGGSVGSGQAMRQVGRRQLNDLATSNDLAAAWALD